MLQNKACASYSICMGRMAMPADCERAAAAGGKRAGLKICGVRRLSCCERRTFFILHMPVKSTSLAEGDLCVCTKLLGGVDLRELVCYHYGDSGVDAARIRSRQRRSIYV